MSFGPDLRRLVRSGRLQIRAVRVRVVIVRSDIRYGSSDHEDPPETWEDEIGEFFDVWYGSTGEPDVLRNAASGFSTLDDATSYMTKFDAMIWDDSQLDASPESEEPARGPSIGGAGSSTAISAFKDPEDS